MTPLDPASASFAAIAIPIIAWLLFTIITLVILYLIIKVAVRTALREHQLWLDKRHPRSGA